MEYPEGTPHGHFCLALPSPTYTQPFQAPLNRPSISGAAATNYCGIAEALTTCEAVLGEERLALHQHRRHGPARLVRG